MRTFAARLAATCAITLLALTGVAASPQPATAAPPERPLRVDAPIPSVTLSPAGPIDGFLGDYVTFTATFDNAAAPDDNVGYGPFIDLYIESSGTQGANGLGTATITATIFNGSVTLPVQVLTFSGATVTHPLAVDSSGNGIPVSGTVGDSLVVIALPFGSFTEDQPPLDVEITVNIDGQASVGTLLNVYARGGFQYGFTPLNDYCCGDPSIVNPAGAPPTWPNLQVNPIVLTLNKEHDGLDGSETATGPNYPRQYTLTVDIADGQTVAGLQVSDSLDDNVQFVSASGSSGSAVSLPSTTTPGGTLTWDFGNVLGGPGSNDATLTIDFYIPLDNASATRVIDPDSGDSVISENDASVDGGAWTPTNGDPSISYSTTPSPCLNCPNELIDRSLAIQKTVAIQADNGPGDLSPTDTLEYTINFQVSDFFAFDDIVVTDTFGDGQTFDATFTPTLSVTQNGVTFNGNFTMGSTAILGSQNGTTGDTPLTFDVSTVYGSQFIGGLVTDGLPADDGPTTGTITFRTTVNDAYTVLFPSGNQSLNQGDEVQNDVQVSGDLLDETTCTSGTCSTTSTETVTDTGSSTIVVPATEVSKSVFAINGAAPTTSPAEIKPGDLVTYAISYDLAIGDFEELSLIDFLPLPVFFAADPDANGSAGPGWTFDPATGVAPDAAGEWTYGAGDTQRFRPGASAPTVSADAAANSVTWDFGTYDDPTNNSATIEILFTVTVSNEPFTDGLNLTNQVREQDQNTSNVGSSGDGIVQVVLTEPVLRTTKSVVSSDNAAAMFTSDITPGAVTGWRIPGDTSTVQWLPGTPAAPITSDNLGTSLDSNVTTVGPNDTLKFVIVVQNTGSSPKGAFDVLIRDTIPPQMQIPGTGPGLNLHITRGDGSTVAFTTVGSGLFDPTGGIQLDDPGLAQGACEAHSVSPGSGRDIILISYDLQILPGVTPGQDIVNTSSIVSYAGDEGGPNHLAQPLEDDAHVLIAETQPGKFANPAVSTLTVGETYTQRIIVEVPADTVIRDRLPVASPRLAQIVDNILDNGLHAIAASVSPTPIIITSCTVRDPVFAATPVLVNDTAAGEDVIFQLEADASGVVIDNTGAAGPCSFAVEIDVQVMHLDFYDNTAYWLPPDLTTATASDSAVFEYSDGATNIDTPVGTLDIPVEQPAIQLVKTAPVIFESDKKTPRAPGDEVRRLDYVVYLLEMTNYGNATAYEVNWIDTLPTDVAYVKNSAFFDLNGNGVRDSGESNAPAPVVTGTPVTGQTLTFNYATDIAPGDTLRVAFRVQVLKSMDLGMLIDNTADADWSTMDGTTPTERVFDDSPDVANDGGLDDDTVSLQVIGLTLDKAFSPNPVSSGGVTTLTFTITNPNTATNLTSIGFTDPLPNGLIIATPGNPVSSCGGAVTARDGARKITFSGGTLAAGATCTVTVDVQPTGEGVFDNTTGPVTSKETGPGDTANAQLISGDELSLHKVFTPSSIPPGGVATLRFTLFNGDAITHTAISFFDTLPLGAPGGAMIIATPPNSTNNGCGGTWAPAANDTFVQFSGGTLTPGQSCTLTVDVTAGGPSTYTNTTDPIASNEQPVGNTSNSAILRVRSNNNTGSGGDGGGDTGTATGGGLTLEKWVTPDSALAGDAVTWMIRVTYNGSEPSSPITISDNVPQVLQINNVSTTRGTVEQNGNSLRIVVGVMQPGQSATVTVDTTLAPDMAPGQVCNDASIGVLNARACMIVLPSQLPPTGGRPVDEFAGWRLAAMIALGALISAAVMVGVGKRSSVTR